MNPKYYFETYKSELIELAKNTSSYSEIQKIMNQRYSNLNKKVINFERHYVAQKLKQWNAKKLNYIVPKTAKDPDVDVDLYNPSSFMSTEMGQIIYGSMLGDGTIHKKNDYFSIGHCEKQKQYLMEKWKLLPFEKTLSIKEPHIHKILNKVCQVQRQFIISSKKHPFLAKIKKDIYKNGKKTINLEYLQYLNVLGLFVWLYDDGFIRCRPELSSSEILICADENSTEILKKTIDILTKNFDFDKISIQGRDKDRLYFNRKSQKRLCDLLIKNIPKSLLYSIPYKYTALMNIMQSFTSGGKTAYCKSRGGDAR